MEILQEAEELVVSRNILTLRLLKCFPIDPDLVLPLTLLSILI